MKKFLLKTLDVFGEFAWSGCLVAVGMIMMSDGIGIIRKYF